MNDGSGTLIRSLNSSSPDLKHSVFWLTGSDSFVVLIFVRAPEDTIVEELHLHPICCFHKFNLGMKN